MARLDRRTQARIVRAVARFAETGHGDVDKVESREPERRLRVGNWRVFFIFEEERRILRVLRGRPRQSAYRP
ncbi:type II toxin-antitoxin system RelE/ParE family toxin [Candidatus Poribacteria bacterium]|nr:type II toxin-antitoxin system RelE/ParE family toxin [Candidatus Poribacteria bacterium]